MSDTVATVVEVTPLSANAEQQTATASIAVPHQMGSGILVWDMAYCNT